MSMTVHHDVPTADLKEGDLVLWKPEYGELYFVRKAPVLDDSDNLTYGTVTLQERQGAGIEWEASIYWPAQWQVIRES